MSKYADDHVCTCEMALVTAKNHLHGSMCELWEEPTFKDGSDEWDGDLGCLMIARNPWDAPEEYVWDGDNPIVRKETATARISNDVQAAIDSWIEAQSPDKDRSATGIEIISELEEEALGQLTAGDADADEFGLVHLNDGSFADFDTRVTYRRVIGDDGGISWTEMFWDDPINLTLEEADEQAMTEQDHLPLDCTCTTLKKFYCSTCKVQRDTVNDPWRPWAGHNNVNGGYHTPGSTYSTGTSYTTWKSCNHCFDEFELPGGQDFDIRISGKRAHGPDTTPDYGLYAYAQWFPSCVHTFIPWQDYGLPTVDFAKAARAIKDAWDRAAEGEVVEVGCMGGHGRTGTILACMAILSKPELTARAAVAHVRRVHCSEAVETNEQVWFVEWFRSHHLGTTCPPKPTHYVSKHSANWNAASKAAQATKEMAPAAPKAPGSTMTVYPVGGGTTSYAATWCEGCKRVVHVQHNVDCPIDNLPLSEPEVLTFDPRLMGETANKRRRNAKRAIRRAARRQAKMNA